MFPGLMQSFGQPQQAPMQWGSLIQSAVAQRQPMQWGGLLQSMQPQMSPQFGGWAGANRGYAPKPMAPNLNPGMIPMQPPMPQIAPGMQGMSPGLQMYNGPMMNLGMSGMRY